jgi:hypothetical protein
MPLNYTGAGAGATGIHAWEFPTPESPWSFTGTEA